MQWLTLFTEALKLIDEPSQPTSVRPSDKYATPLNENSGNGYDLRMQLLYEYYLPIDTIVFLIGAYRLSSKEVNYIVESVLKAKAAVIKDKKALDSYTNFSGIQSNSSTSALLAARNKICENDTSFICNKIIKEKQQEMVRRLEKMEGYSGPGMNVESAYIRGIGDSLKDEEYREMVIRLKNVVYEDGPIGQALRDEKGEFYRNYSTVPEAVSKRIRIALSLGGFIIETASLPGLIGKINMADKDSAVRKWIRSIMGQVEELELQIRTKSFVEARRIVVKFLEKCLALRNERFAEAMEARSSILRLALGTDSAINFENWKQERFIKEMIVVVRNMKKANWIVRYNKDITEDYIAYLLTGQSSEKKVLLKHFEN